MGLSDSYNERQRQKSNEKAKEFLKDQGCLVLLIVGLSVSTSIILGTIKILF